MRPKPSNLFIGITRKGVIFSMADVDDPAIGESPIYETADERDTFSIGTVYPVKGIL